MNPLDRAVATWSEADLTEVETRFAEGMTVQQIVDAITAKGDRLTEPTFRKYVQMGLLPRSVRVGRKGKHRGSQGLYPATVVRQIVQLRRLMAEGFTIGEIQSEFLSLRGDIEALTKHLERVLEAMKAASVGRGDDIVDRTVREARALSDELTTKLESVERRLSMRARMRRAVV